MDFGIHNDRQIRMSNYINGRNLIFFPTKKKLKSMLICKISASYFVFNYMARTQYASDTT